MRKLLTVSILAVVVIVFWVWINSPMIVTVTGTGAITAVKGKAFMLTEQL